jgi:hypothetical protein
MSPDGRYLAAISSDSTSLYIRDNRAGTWNQRVSMFFMQDPVWSPDSGWLQFTGKPERLRTAIYRIEPFTQMQSR